MSDRVLLVLALLVIVGGAIFYTSAYTWMYGLAHGLVHEDVRVSTRIALAGSIALLILAFWPKGRKQ